jgi:hypothetical protein
MPPAAGLRDGGGALERDSWSVVKWVCLHPVTLPPEGSQTAGHRVNPGEERPGVKPRCAR